MSANSKNGLSYLQARFAFSFKVGIILSENCHYVDVTSELTRKFTRTRSRKTNSSFKQRVKIWKYLTFCCNKGFVRTNGCEKKQAFFNDVSFGMNEFNKICRQRLVWVSSKRMKPCNMFYKLTARNYYRWFYLACL